MVRGKELGPEITQLNLKIIEYGPKTVEELLGAEG
jgi:ribosomal protein S6E (S10)